MPPSSLRPFPLLASLLLFGLLSCVKKPDTPPITPPPPTSSATTFTNPLLASGPDPWVAQKDGFYYFMATTGNNITLRKTAKMSELRSAPSVVAWTPPASGTNSRDVWAPELHFLDGKWYIYFTAGPGNCCGGQRLWVLENASPDPTQGTWTERGRIYNPTADFWAIDGTVYEQGGKRYLLWSGHRTDGDDTQRLYISEMSNPWTLTGPRVELSSPQYTWEKFGPLEVNEGPEMLQHNGTTYLIYSASHCNTDDYALGQLRISSSADPLVAANWTKTPTPVFAKNPAANAYGPGHNGFFVSKDGTQNWLVYHANTNANEGCGNPRNPRMQPFTWNADGSPNFGTPLPLSSALPRPAGE